MDELMRFPARVPLKPERAPKGFLKTLHTEVQRAKRHTQQASTDIPPETVLPWAAGTDREMMEQHDGHEGLVNAVTGLHYSMLAGHLPGGTKWFVGALGQIRLTRALMLLPRAARRELMSIKELRPYTFGALGTAVLAASLGEVGAECFLPDASDDAVWMIDLFCESLGRTSAIQVKAGPWKAERVHANSQGERLEYWKRIRLYNEYQGQRCIPLWASVRVEEAHVTGQLHNEASVRFAQDLVSYHVP